MKFLIFGLGLANLICCALDIMSGSMVMAGANGLIFLVCLGISLA